MPVVVVHQGPSLTQDKYEEAVRRLTDGKSRLESLADWPAEGILFHTAGQGENGFRVVDVWESEEAFGRFGEVLGADHAGDRCRRSSGGLHRAHVRVRMTTV